jgi:DNA-binding response OmpR family regulator
MITSETTPETNGRAAPVAPGLAEAPGGTETILVVLPEGPLRKAVRRILAQRGYRVLDAPDADAALGLAGSLGGDIHLLVTAFVLPGTGGRELARRLRQARPALKQLFLSQHEYGSLVERSLFEAGARLLRKPFTPLELLHAARRTLDEG